MAWVACQLWRGGVCFDTPLVLYEKGRASVLKVSRICLAAVVAIVLAARVPARGQSIDPPGLKPGTIVGTVKDTNGAPVPNATVVLKSADGVDTRTIVTTATGLFQFHNVRARVPYKVTVSAKNFAEWKSPAVTVQPDQFKILPGVQLQIPTQVTSVKVTYNPVQVATQQLKVEEKQRVLGIFPNYYVTYAQNPAPLTSGMKFRLALKVSYDPVTIAGVLIVAAVKQAGNTPDYGQGWAAFGKRVGAVSADGFSDIIIGGAILPSLLHQDPRYFYQGTGTKLSRARQAMLSPFETRGDNGKWQPNYSSLGGDLASAGLANLYYPPSSRGAGLVFTNFGLGTAERVLAGLAQEFVLARFTKRGGHVKAGGVTPDR